MNLSRSNAEIAAAIEENLADTHCGHELATEGVTTVALDEDGNLMEHRPDGSCSPVSAPTRLPPTGMHSTHAW